MLRSLLWVHDPNGESVTSERTPTHFEKGTRRATTSLATSVLLPLRMEQPNFHWDGFS